MSPDVTPIPRTPRIVDSKAGRAKVLDEGRCRACRVSSIKGGLTRHHLVSRSLGGDDLDDNIIPLCGHGTLGCHGTYETRLIKPGPGSALTWREIAASIRESLRPEEEEYVLSKKGAAWLDKAYPAQAGAGARETQERTG